MWKYLLLWIPMVFIAVANGVVREAWYGRHLSELRAHQLSTLTGVVLFGLYIWIVLGFFRPVSAVQALTIGLLWLGLTVAFEFVFGPYVAGHAWGRLFQDYHLLAGRVWVLVLVWLTVAPSVFYWWWK
jgi:hypothetical protein